MVLLFAAGQEVPERVEAEQGGGERVLEGDGGGQADREAEGAGDKEGVGVLRWESPQRGQDQLDHARVSPRQCRQIRRQQKQQPKGMPLPLPQFSLVFSPNLFIKLIIMLCILLETKK